MAAFRISHPAIQWTDDLWNLVPDGSVEFYDSGTTTPRAVYSNADGTGSLGTTLDIDASGRTVDFWRVGEYRVILKDADGDQVWLRENVRDQVTGGVTLPDPGDGEDGDVPVVSGSGYALETIRRLPDPTGSDGYMVVVDGDEYALQAQPTAEPYTIPEGGITQPSGSVFTIGDIMVQTGSGTAPATGTLHSTYAVTFGTAFGGTPTHISLTPASASSTGEGAGASAQVTSPGTGGFTANFYVGAEDMGGVAEINSTIPFTYLAIGPAP